MSSWSEKALSRALQHHGAGELGAAEALYRQILAQEPRNADALHLLGALAHQIGRNDAAIELISQAIQINGRAAEYHNNLAAAYRARGDVAGAERTYRNAIAIQPNYADAHANLGMLLLERGDATGARQSFEQALGLQPNHVGAMVNLGVALSQTGEPEAAIALLVKAIELSPNDVQAWINLAAVLHKHRSATEALAAARRAVELAPQAPAAHYNHAAALRALERFEDALAAFHRAVGLKPDYVDALNGIALSLNKLRRYDEALDYVRHAATLNPNDPFTLCNLGGLLVFLHRSKEGLPICRRAVELNPELAEAWGNLSTALYELGDNYGAVAAAERAISIDRTSSSLNNLAMALNALGRTSQAIEAYRECLRLDPTNAAAHSNLLLILHYQGRYTPRQIADEHQEFSRMHEVPMLATHGPHDNTRDLQRRLRIGYTSVDFRRHSVNYFIQPLLANHDREQFEVHVYADEIWSDATTDEFRTLVQHWHNVTRLNDQELAQRVRADQIDIWIDLAGHTAYNRMLAFARKAAPVQVTYLGYPDTTGLKSMDYRLTDALADPPGMTEALHSEELVRLPGCAWCYSPPPESLSIQRPQRAADEPITFGSFNILTKITPRTIATWSRILRDVPGSRLIFKSRAGEESAHIAEAFTLQGIERARLEFRRREPSYVGHLELYNRIDIALDTFPYHGTTTTCEALWMGVPVVTLAGDAHISRVGVSLLSAIGLEELVAGDDESYIIAAVKLTKDRARLSELQLDLRERMRTSVLMDAPGFTTKVESAYREMWRRYCGAP